MILACGRNPETGDLGLICQEHRLLSFCSAVIFLGLLGHSLPKVAVRIAPMLSAFQGGRKGRGKTEDQLSAFWGAFLEITLLWLSSKMFPRSLMFTSGALGGDWIIRAPASSKGQSIDEFTAEGCGQVGPWWSRSLGVCLEGCIFSFALFLPTACLRCHEVSSFSPPGSSARIFVPWSQPTRSQTSETVRQNKSFLLLS